MRIFAAIIACAGLIIAGGPARAAEPVPVTIVVFTPPSLGAICPSVIKQQKFEIANGVDITF
ncbi:MAG: ABC transporter substrate-binding protein, partial [Xanthobacteraceae bacterium]